MTSLKIFTIQNTALVSMPNNSMYCISLHCMIIIIDKFEPVKFPRPTPRVPQPEVPPYNGFGSEEDSLQSCQYLIPRPPRKDFVKFMEKDR